MRLLRFALALGAFFVLAVALAACGSGVPGDSVAVIDGNPITQQAFNHWMYIAAKGNASQAPGAPVIVPNDPPNFAGCIAQVRKQIPSLAKTPDKTVKTDCAQLFQSLSGEVMHFLITAYWYQADAHKLGVNVSDGDVQKAFDKAKKQQFPTVSAFNTFLSTTGQTLQDILFRVRINEIYKKLIARQSHAVTTAAITAYYNAHQTQFGTPENRDLRIVRTNSQAQAQAALAALKSGGSWTTVAKKYSVDAATKNNGGILTAVTHGEEEHALDTAAFAAPVNKVQGPLHGTFGWYVFEVTKITAAKTQTLAQATPLIKQLLTSQSSTGAQTAVDAKAKKDWGSKTTCRAAFTMADCKGYKAPKTSTTGAAPQTVTAPQSTTPPSSTGTTTTP